MSLILVKSLWSILQEEFTTESQRASRRIVSPCVPRVTSTKAPEALPGAADGAVLVDCEDEILAATGVITADCGKYGTQHSLVKAYGKYHGEDCNRTQGRNVRIHHERPVSRARLRATLLTSRGSPCFNSSNGGSTGDRGIKTRSMPTGISWRVRRNASRYRRRSRLRRFAGPILPETESPNRKCGKPFSQP